MNKDKYNESLFDAIVMRRKGFRCITIATILCMKKT